MSDSAAGLIHLDQRLATTTDPGATRVKSWLAGKPWAVFLLTLYPLAAVTPLATFAILNPVSDRPRAGEVGVDCALVGFAILALQFVITARLSWVEAPFGLDVLLSFHRVMALVATVLLSVHPLAVAWAEGGALLVGLHMPWSVWAGRVTLALVLLQVTVSLSRRAMRLPFDRWRRLHTPLALTVLALGFAHSLTVGDDVHGGGMVVWVTMTVIAFGCWLYSRMIRPRLLLRRPFRVVAVKPETARVWTLTLEAPENRPFEFAPGQFQFLRLYGAGTSAEDHPFTIASSPARTGRICVTIKESGDFTAGIGRVRPGDRATVHGPFGRFSYDLHPDEGDLVFVAGGVGITPLMSMLRCMRDRREPRRVLLVYANRTPADIVFADELDAMQAGEYPMLEVVHVVVDTPPSWVGETGRLDAERLARLCGSVEGRAFYLCCPPQMTTALVRGLRRRGVSPRLIHADYFSL